MSNMADIRRRVFSRFAKIVFNLVLVSILLTCADPLNLDILAEVEDLEKPIITITSPDPNLIYDILSTNNIDGTIVDYSDASHTISGEILSAGYSDEFNGIYLGKLTDPANQITIDNAGNFTFSFSGLDLDTTLTLVITAVDWNGNVGTYPMLLRKDNTGPNIAISYPETPEEKYYSSESGSLYTISGQVGSDATKMWYDLEYDENVIFTNKSIAFANNSFSLEENLSPYDYDLDNNAVTIVIWGQDSQGNETNYTIIITNDPNGPVLKNSETMLAPDNSSISIEFDEEVYASLGGIGALTKENFKIVHSVDISFAEITGFLVTPTAGDTIYKLIVSITEVPDGSETITLSPNLDIFDRVGNPSGFSTEISLKDKKPPTVLSASQIVPGNKIEVEFSETMDPDAKTPAYYKNNNIEATAADLVGNIVTLTFDTVTSTAGLAITGGVINDVAGNSLASPVPNVLIADGIPPVAPIVTINDNVNDDTPDGYINFIENSVLGVPFTITGEVGAIYEITPTNCSLPNLPAVGSRIIPAGGDTSIQDLRLIANGDGPVSVSVTLTDGSNNTSGAGIDSSTAKLSVAAPTVTIDDDNDDSSPVGYINITESSNLDFKINGEEGALYSIDQLVKCVITPLSGTITDDGDDNLVELKDTADISITNVEHGDVSFSVILTDRFGNVSLPGTGNSIADLIAPTLTILDDIGAIISDDSNITFTFEFSEPVANFSGNNISVSGGSEGSINEISPSEYTMVSDPTDNFEGDVTVSVSVSSDDPEDYAGNDGPASVPLYIQEVDTKQPENPNGTLTYPNTSGLNFAGGSSQTILWTHTDIKDGGVIMTGSPISLHYTPDNGTSWVDIDLSEENDGTFDWSVPNINSDNVKVRITTTDVAGNTKADTSNNTFIIDSPPSIKTTTLTNPIGINSWEEGTPQTIIWTDSDIVDDYNWDGKISIEYSINSGVWTEISSNIDNSGSFAWTVPLVDADSSAKVRVKAEDDESNIAIDESDSFTIKNVP